MSRNRDSILRLHEAANSGDTAVGAQAIDALVGTRSRSAPAVVVR